MNLRKEKHFFQEMLNKEYDSLFEQLYQHIGDQYEKQFFDTLSDNPYLNLSFFVKYVKKPWNWRKISLKAKFITKTILVDLKDCPWNFQALSHNPVVTWEIISTFRHKNWNWEAISSHQNISWEIITLNPNIPWSIAGLSNNPNICFKVVNENLHIPWDLDIITSKSYDRDFLEIPCDTLRYLKWNINNDCVTLENNPDVSFQFIRNKYSQMKDETFIQYVVKNIQLHHQTKTRLFKYYRACTIIVRQIETSMLDPQYLMCKKRLLKEYLQLTT